MSIDPKPYLQVSSVYSSDLPKTPLVIGVAGGSASGKKTVCKKIMERISQKHGKAGRQIAVLSLADFYREFTEEEKELAKNGEMNFDHPNAFDFDLVEKTIDSLKAGKEVTLPSYDPVTRTRNMNSRVLSPPDVVLFEGILILYEKRIRESLSMKIFVDVDADTRLSQRVLQHMEHDTSLDYILNEYVRFVKPAYEDFVLPTKKTADIIIPRGASNLTAIELISSHVEARLVSRATQKNPELEDEERVNLTPTSSVLDTKNLFFSAMQR